jgi:hypothetical protein
MFRNQPTYTTVHKTAAGKVAKEVSNGQVRYVVLNDRGVIVSRFEDMEAAIRQIDSEAVAQ